MTADTQLAGRARRTKADEAMNAILRYIKANDLKMGERLPSEREMTEMFSIGRASIREAIKVLCMMNILEVHPQGGTFISTFSANSSYDQFRLFLQSGHINMEEIFETRLILETECIALAAKNITDEQLETIRKNISAVDVENTEGFAEADRALHDTIYAATGNRALEYLMQTVKMWTVVSQSFTNTFEEVRRIVHRDHQDIYNALSRRAAELSREAMRKHIMHVDRIQQVSDTVMRTELAKLLDKD